MIKTKLFELHFRKKQRIYFRGMYDTQKITFFAVNFIRNFTTNFLFHLRVDFYWMRKEKIISRNKRPIRRDTMNYEYAQNILPD